MRDKVTTADYPRISLPKITSSGTYFSCEVAHGPGGVLVVPVALVGPQVRVLGVDEQEGASTHVHASVHAHAAQITGGPRQAPGALRL